MTEKEFDIEQGTPLVLHDVGGDLKVAGWDNAHVALRIDDEESSLTVEQTEAGLEISARASCEVSLPAGSPVTVEQAMGNAKVRDLQGELRLGAVHGDLKLVAVGDVTIGEVHGNLKAENLASLRVERMVHGDAKVSDAQAVDLARVQGNVRVNGVSQLRAAYVAGDMIAKDVEGTVEAGQIRGNAILGEVTGVATLDRVGGDLLGKGLLGGAQVNGIGGNLVLSGAIGSGCTYRFKAGGDAVLKLDEDAGAHLALRAGGQVLASIPVTESERTRQTLSGTLGAGGAELMVEAGGNVILRQGEPARVAEGDAGGDWERFGATMGAEISRQVEESLRAIDMEAISRKANEEIERAMAQLRVKLESVDWERLGGQAQQAVERAMSQMQRDIDRLAEKAAREQERAARAAEQAAARQQRRASRPSYVDWQPVSPMPPAAPAPSYDQERLSILKMVEEGKITPEEAGILLDALR